MVKCSECGFLAARRRATGEWVEADDRFRDSGRPGNDDLLEPYPACFERVINMKDLAIAYPVDGRDQKVLGIINEERQCAKFISWLPGDSPNEHREMQDRERMLKWQVEREKEDKAFRARESRANRKYSLIVLVLFMATIVAVLWTAFIGRGGQPTVNIITSDKPSVTQSTQPGGLSGSSSNVP